MMSPRRRQPAWLAGLLPGHVIASLAVITPQQVHLPAGRANGVLARQRRGVLDKGGRIRRKLSAWRPFPRAVCHSGTPLALNFSR